MFFKKSWADALYLYLLSINLSNTNFSVEHIPLSFSSKIPLLPNLKLLHPNHHLEPYHIFLNMLLSPPSHNSFCFLLALPDHSLTYHSLRIETQDVNLSYFLIRLPLPKLPLTAKFKPVPCFKTHAL